MDRNLREGELLKIAVYLPLYTPATSNYSSLALSEEALLNITHITVEQMMYNNKEA